MRVGVLRELACLAPALAAIATLIALASAASAISIQPHTPALQADFVIPGGSNDMLADSISAGRWTGGGGDDLLVCSVSNNSCWLHFGGSGVGGARSLMPPDIVFVGVGGSWGFASSFIGDVNGDGFEDLAIGAPYSAGLNGTLYGGSLWIFLSRGDDWTGSIGYYEASSTIFGVGPWGYLGSAVAPAGDVNVDGFADFWVSAPGRYDGATRVGAVYLVLGRASWPAEVSLNSSALRIIGAAAWGSFGQVLLGRADVNADGVPDLMTGAPNYPDAGGLIVGAAFAFVGPLPVDGRTLDSDQATVTFWGNQMVYALGSSLALSDNFLNTSVAGRFVIVGATTNTGGAIYVYKPSTWTCCQVVNTWDALGLIYTFDSYYSYGITIAAGADFDGNGRGDLVVGAPHATVGNRASAGRVTVVYGGDPSGQPYLLNNSTSAVEASVNSTQFGFIVLLCDFNADGLADLVASAPGDKTKGSNAGLVSGFIGRPRNRAPHGELNTTSELVEGSPIIIRALLDDADGDQLTWNWSGLYSGMNVEGSGSSTVTVTFRDQGTFFISVDVFDGEFHGRAQILLVLVNAPPTCEIRWLTNFTEGERNQLTVSLSDPGATDVLEHAWSGPPYMGAVGLAADYVPPRGEPFYVRVNVTDGDGGEGFCEALVGVANIAPKVTLSGPTVLYEGEGATYTATVKDPGIEDQFTFRWSGANGQASGYSYSWVPSRPGIYQLTLNVTDLDGGSGATVLAVRVLSAPPDASLIFPGVATEGDRVNITLKQFSGQTYDPLTLFWKVCGPGTQVGMEWQVQRAEPGEFCVEVTAIDDDGDSRTFRGNLTVANRAPLQTVKITPQAPYTEGTEITAEAVLGSWETTPLNAIDFEWLLDGNEISSRSSVKLLPPAGIHKLTLTAKDSYGGVSRTNTTLRVDNLAPTLHINGPTSLLPGAVGNWTAAAADASGIAPNLTWDVDGQQVANGPSFSWSSRTQGPHILRITADDGAGGITVVTLIVSVAPPPPINAGLDLRWAAVPLGAAAAFAAGIMVGAWAYGRWREKRKELDGDAADKMWKN